MSVAWRLKRAPCMCLWVSLEKGYVLDGGGEEHIARNGYGDGVPKVEG